MLILAARNLATALAALALLVAATISDCALRDCAWDMQEKVAVAVVGIPVVIAYVLFTAFVILPISA